MNRNTKSLLLIVITLLFTLALAACAGDPEENDNDTSGGDNTEGNKSGDLIIVNADDAVSLDPNGSNDLASYNVQINIYETLLKQDENMELQPGLAKSWKALEDDLWEFKLQEDVTFHDGSAFNADVVKQNIERILDPEVGSSQASLFEMITEINVIDDYTIQLKTEYPFAPLPAHLAHPVSGIVSPELIDEDYAAMEDGKDPGALINEHPIGTGYFKFDEWQPGDYVRLVRNDEYWDEPALLDSVTFKVAKEDGTRIAEITTGDSHVSNPVSPSDVVQLEQTDDVNAHEQASVRLEYIGFNMAKEPFDDERVRQAISMAIDNEEIIDGIYDGFGSPAVGPIPPDIPGFDDSVSGLDYDVEKAKELLADAGYEDGFSTSIWTDDTREAIDTAVYVQAQLKDLGIDVKVEELEWGTFLDKTAKGEHDMLVIGWTNGTGDIDYGTYPLFHSKNVGNPGNRTFTEDPELDKLLDQGRQTPDPEERHKIYKDMQELLVDIAPMIYTHHPVHILGVRDEVKGLKQLPTSYLILKDVYIEE